jgi:hypothetical protein
LIAVDVTIRALGRVFLLSRSGSYDSIVAREIDWLLSDPSSSLLRYAVRALLAALGQAGPHDDAELRARVRDLLESGRLGLRDVTGTERYADYDDVTDDPNGDEPEPEPPGPDEPVTTQQKFKLVELVEVVERGGALGTVGGAAQGSALLPKHVDRTEKAGACWKQFINLGKDIDGAAQRHPENGRFIELRARIEWVSGDKTRSLSGKNVKWKVTVTKHAGAGRPASFAVDAEKEGIGGTNGLLEKTTSTDDKGWTSVRVHVSQYAGDQLSVSAEVDTSDGEAQGGPALSAGPYVVWRKFWYQLTKPSGSAVPTPADSIAAYDKVGAAMLAADEVTFAKTDNPAPPDRTFYPKGMTTTGSSDATDIALIGGHNRNWFWGKFNAETSRPVKGHLIICDGQWDPASAPTALQQFELTARTEELTLDLGGAHNAGILKPALSGAVITQGSWTLDPALLAQYAAGTPGLPPKPAKVTGTLSDADVSIPLPRADLNKITVTLPADAPDPTVYKVLVRLRVAYGKFYGGESVGINMLITYKSGNAAYFQAVSHELGHGFGQVPDKKNSDSLTDHPKQYDENDGHGGLGSHCSTGVTTGAVDSGAANGRYKDGTCIMFHQLSPSTCTQTFCADCEPHLRLQRFDALT